MMMYKYWGFGLKIISEIEFIELLPIEFEEADVHIKFGNTPKELEGEHLLKRAFSSANQYEYILNIRHVCKYYVGFGKDIIVEPVAGIDENSIRLFILGTIMAVVLYQRGVIPLHASAIIKDGELIVFTGNSEAGKSTLVAKLAIEGYEIFTDDICVISLDDNGNLYGTASYPMIKLWTDAITKLNSDRYLREYKIRPELPKFGQFFFESFNTDKIPVGKIFILNPKPTIEEIEINKLTGIQAFRRMEHMAYKSHLISINSLRPAHFALLTKFATQVPIYQADRPLKDTKVEELSEALKKYF